MKWFFISVILIFNSIVLTAQVNHSVSFGPELGILTNIGGRNTTITGHGGSMEYQLKFQFPLALHFHAGYNRFKDEGGSVVSFLPVRAGLTGYMFENLIFLMADAGVSHYYSPTTGTNQNGFSFGFGGGYKLPLWNKQFMQFSAYYNLHNYRDDTWGQNYNYGWFNIRAGYGFSFGGKNPK